MILFKCDYDKEKDSMNIDINPNSTYIDLLGGVTVLIRTICKSGMVKFNNFIYDICGANQMISLHEKQKTQE